MEKLPRFPDEKLLAESLRSPHALEQYERLALGYQIKKLRKKLGLKQSALAKKLKTSQSAIARMEAGKQNCSLGLLVKIGFLLGKRLHVRFL